MTSNGHTVFHYGHPDSDVPCTQHFNVVSRATYNKVYKKESWKNFLPQSIKNQAHEEFNKNAAPLIKKNKQSKNDFVLAFWGVVLVFFILAVIFLTLFGLFAFLF